MHTYTHAYIHACIHVCIQRTHFPCSSSSAEFMPTKCPICFSVDGKWHKIGAPSESLRRSALSRFAKCNTSKSKASCWKQLLKEWALRRHKNCQTKCSKAAKARWHVVKGCKINGGAQVWPDSKVFMAIVRKHTGRGQLVANGLLSIALCHSLARRAVSVHDILILVTAKPSTTLQPPEYRAAVNDLKVRERASVLQCSVDSLLSRRQYFLGKTGRWRSDNWYRRATHTDTVTWKDSDGLAWARRARVRVGADGEAKISKEHNCLCSAFNAKSSLCSAFNAKSIALLLLVGRPA